MHIHVTLQCFSPLSKRFFAKFKIRAEQENLASKSLVWPGGGQAFISKCQPIEKAKHTSNSTSPISTR